METVLATLLTQAYAYVNRDMSRAWETLMPQAYIVDAVRTPRGIGKQGKGALAHMHPLRAAGQDTKNPAAGP